MSSLVQTAEEENWMRLHQYGQWAGTLIVPKQVGSVDCELKPLTELPSLSPKNLN